MNASVLIALTAVFAVVCILLVVFFNRLKSVFLLVLHTCIGWAGLYIFNMILPGLAIGINIASASLAGVLGLPGLLLMIILKFLYK